MDLVVQALVVVALFGVFAGRRAFPMRRAYWQPVLEALIQAAGLPQVSGLAGGLAGDGGGPMHGVIGASLLFTLVMALMLALWLDREVRATTGGGNSWNCAWGGCSHWVRPCLLLISTGFVSLGGGLLCARHGLRGPGAGRGPLDR